MRGCKKRKPNIFSIESDESFWIPDQTVEKCVKKRKKVVISGIWSLASSHEVREGVSEYIETCDDIALIVSGSDTLSEIKDWEIDGLIVSVAKEQAGLFDASPFPVVSVVGDPDLDLPYVDADPEACGALAADYLLGLGHTHFAAICRPFAGSHRARSAGFARRLMTRNVQFEGEYFLEPGELESPERWKNMASWVQALEKPAAIFCTDDCVGSQILSLMSENGIYAPEDISVLGCENEPVFCNHVHPTLSSIQLPYKKNGFEAIRLLDQLMQGKSPKNKQLLFPPENVVVRMSTNTLATKDDRLRKAFSYIQQHALENITISQVAQHAGVSTRDLQRRFQAKLGRSPKQELLLVRMNRVKELLRKTDLSLPEIAEKTGFISECWMGTLFTKTVGYPPGLYRKKNRLR